MNEWQLQEALTKRWLQEGIRLSDDKLLLVAWELMVPSWEINDAAVRWDEPSIDFLAIDGSGRLVAIELKVAVSGRKPAWAVLCQVTHRAICIERTASSRRLGRAHDACLRGDHGRAGPSRGEVESVRSRFRKFFGSQLHEPLSIRPGVRRVVAAMSYGPSFAAIRRDFDETPMANLLRHLSMEYPSNKDQAAKEFGRLSEVLPISASELAAPVETLIVDP